MVIGIAWGGGGRGVNRVDVSLDNGKNFTRAEMLEKPIEQKRKSEWSWTFFEKTIPLPDDLRQKLQDGEKVELTLTSKAFNSAWNVQPENPNYNAHGCCVNHWYRVPITISPTTPEDIKFEGEFRNSPSGGKFTAPFRNLESPDMLRQREAEGFKIRGIVFDCGNQGIMSELGFYQGRYHFKNPADPARDICLFPG